MIAQLAEGDKEDVDLAVAAARRAFRGPWSKFTPAQRQNVMLKLADLVEERLAELSLLDSVDMGAPIAGGLSDMVVETLRYYAGWATKIQGETVPNSNPGSIFSYTLKEPVGVVGPSSPGTGRLALPL